MSPELIVLSIISWFLAHSKNELMQWRVVRRLSVRPSVRLSVCKLLHKPLLLPRKWSDRYQTCTRWTPGQRASSVCSRWRSRSKVTWYAHFLGFLEWATPSLMDWLKFVSILNSWNKFLKIIKYELRMLDLLQYTGVGQAGPHGRNVLWAVVPAPYKPADGRVPAHSLVLAAGSASAKT